MPNWIVARQEKSFEKYFDNRDFTLTEKKKEPTDKVLINVIS